MNRTFYLLPLILLITFNPAFSQRKVQKVWVYGESKKLIDEGFLLQLKDSSILISDSWPGINKIAREIKIADIHLLKFRNRNRPASTALGAALIGGAVSAGVVLIYASGDNYSPDVVGNMTAFSLVPGAISGAIAGALIGTGRKKIRINGSQESYLSQRPFMSMHFKMAPTEQSGLVR